MDELVERRDVPADALERGGDVAVAGDCISRVWRELRPCEQVGEMKQPKCRSKVIPNMPKPRVCVGWNMIIAGC